MSPLQGRDSVYEVHIVGRVHSPFEGILDAPRQGHLSDRLSDVIIDEAFADALQGIEVSARVWIVSWAHLADRSHLSRADGTGAFAGRSPHRPNPILITEVVVVERRGCTLVVRGLDLVDGTPVLDIKPATAEHEGPMPFIANVAAMGAAGVRFDP